MIVKILSPNANFSGVTYNTDKVDRNKGELMVVANFGPLQGMNNLRPQDYINYLKMVSALNSNISKPQFHAVISGKGKSYHKDALCKIAEAWLKEMGYCSQPYLIVFHKDTENNHVHIVSTRVNRNGVKISSGNERWRAVENMRKVLGYQFGFGYKFSTRAQFLMVLESQGFLGIDPDEKKIQQKIDQYKPDKVRAAVLRELLLGLKDHPAYSNELKASYNVELIFHAAEGKRPYGYTIIDHAEKMVFKGSEVLSLKILMDTAGAGIISTPDQEPVIENFAMAFIQSIRISDDVDDQQVHGMKRRRQKKARTNTR